MFSYNDLMEAAKQLLPRALVMLPLLSLTACATSVVLKQDSAKVSESTKATVIEARKFYAQLSERRIDYLISVLATGTNCRYGFPAVLLADDTEIYGWRCLTGEEHRQRLTCLDSLSSAGCNTSQAQILVAAPEFPLSSLEQSAALALVDTMADYQILLARILADPQIDAKAELTALQGRANALKAVLDSLSGESSAGFDFSKEIGALGTLIDLIRKANEDNRDLAALRVLMDQDGVEFEHNLIALAARHRALDAPSLLLFDEMQLSREMGRLNSRLPNLDEAARIKAMRAQASAELALETRRTAPNPIAQAFDALLTSHATLRTAVVEGRLTDDQRRRRADVALTQLKAWFDAIRSVINLM